jgi:hypothetical protein
MIPHYLFTGFLLGIRCAAGGAAGALGFGADLGLGSGLAVLVFDNVLGLGSGLAVLVVAYLEGE